MLTVRSRNTRVHEQYHQRSVSCDLTPSLGSALCTSYVPGYSKREEYIAFDPEEQGGKYVWKEFEHYKRQTLDPTYILEGVASWLPPGVVGIGHNFSVPITHPYELYSMSSFGSPGKIDSELPVLVNARDDGGFIDPPSDLDKLIAKSLRTMWPGIKNELSVLNSIYELKDIKTAPRTFNKILDVFRTISPTKMARLKLMSRSAADSYLQEQFNILPLGSDIQAIIGLLSKTQKRINDLVSRAGRTQVSHFRFTWQELPDPEDEWRHVGYNNELQGLLTGTDGPGFVQTIISEHRKVRSAPTVFHAMMSYNFNFSSFQAEYAQLLGFLDAFGVNPNPAIIWNAIPWSFVVDWVAGVSRWLGDHKISLIEPQVNILQYLWSVTRSRRIEHRAQIQGLYLKPRLQNAVTDIRRPDILETAYRRVPGFPPSSSFTMSGLNLKEISLGAALAIGYRKRRKRTNYK